MTKLAQENLRSEMTKLMLSYKFAISEMTTKISILQEEFKLMHEYSPIEHVVSRVKSPKSIIKKMERKQIRWDTDEIQRQIKDIAGVRIICLFEEDIYKIAQMLSSHADIHVVQVKDYILHPKENGYRSLHVIVEVPIYLSDEVRQVCVELQIRTIAMDFWASLEHKIFYKYNKIVPKHIQDGLKEAAEQATALDRKMANLNEEINILKQNDVEEDDDQGVEKYIRNFLSSVSF